MKKKLKILMGTIGGAAAVAPLAVASMCGGWQTNNDPNRITMTMRMLDMDYWQPIINKFTKQTGIAVELKQTSNAKSEYANLKGAGSMPDLSLADQNTIKYAIDKDWFQKIDLAELGLAKYSVDPVPKTFDFKDSNQFFQPALGPVAADKDSVWGIPYGVGKQGIWYNLNHADDTKDLKAFIPKKDGSGFLEVSTGVKATFENVKKFIANSGKASARDDVDGGLKNDAAIQTEMAKLRTADDANAEWWDVGPMAMYQRMASVALSVAKDGSGMGWVKDAGFAFEIVASAGNGIFDGTQIVDEKLRQIFPTDSKSYSDPNPMTKQGLERFFYSYLGYFRGAHATNITHPGYASTPKAQSEAGEAELMWKDKGTILLGHKWQANMIRDNWLKTNPTTYDNSMRVIPAPYGSISEDSLAISADLQGKKLENVKKFLRFALIDNPQNEYDIAAGKVISPFMASQKLQMDTINNIKDSDVNKNETKANYIQRENGFYSGGTGEKDANGLIGGIVATSNTGAYDIYNNSGEQGLRTLADGGYNGSFAQMINAFKKTMNDAGINFEIMGS